MAMTLEQTKTDLTASFDGTELFRYVFRPRDAQEKSPRPYLHPVRTLAGDTVSLYRPDDRVWHKGTALSLPNVGSMVHGSFDTAEVKDDVVTLGERLTWVPEDRTYAIIIEHRRLAAVAWPSDQAWGLAFESSLTNVSEEDIVLGSPAAEGAPDDGDEALGKGGPWPFVGTNPGSDTEQVFSAGAWLTVRHDIIVANGALDADQWAALAERAGEKDLLA